jgi:flap endonuclease-1
VGLPIRDIVPAEELPWERLAGRILAVDGHNAIYQFLATIRQRDGSPFTGTDGRTTSHLIGLFYRTTSLLSEGIWPVWVFDGRPPELKAATIRARVEAKERATAAWKEALEAGDLETARRKAAQTSRFTASMVTEAIELLDALGVPTVRAPSEGEAQAARMAADGRVWAAASQDYDSLLFGAPRLVRGLAARSRGGGPTPAEVIDREALLARLGISSEELILLGLLVGTDFNEGAAGYGPKRALKLVQKHLGWAQTLRTAGLAPDELDEAAAIFRSPPSTAVPPFEFRPADEPRVLQLLVESRGFSEARVRAALARLAKAPPRTPSAPPDGRRQASLDTFGDA